MCLPECYPLTSNAHTILVPHVMIKINDCGLKFSVLQWRVLIEEDKDDTLQFAKVFPAKFLKLPIRQSFSPPPFCTIWYLWCSKSIKLWQLDIATETSIMEGDSAVCIVLPN